MWTCSKCGERLQDDFEVCWSCGTTIDGVEDPHFHSEEARPGTPQLPAAAPHEIPEHLVTLRSCSLPAEAVAIRLRLESSGIPVFLADEFTVTMDWLLSNAIGGIKVQVAQADVPRACEILGIELPHEVEDFEDDEEDDEDEETE